MHDRQAAGGRKRPQEATAPHWPRPARWLGGKVGSSAFSISPSRPDPTDPTDPSLFHRACCLSVTSNHTLVARVESAVNLSFADRPRRSSPQKKESTGPSFLESSGHRHMKLRDRLFHAHHTLHHTLQPPLDHHHHHHHHHRHHHLQLFSTSFDFFSLIFQSFLYTPFDTSTKPGKPTGLDFLGSSVPLRHRRH
jgi:hypothetical protein